MSKSILLQKVRSQKAFTLLELMLSLYILGVISLCLYSTFSQGIRLNVYSKIHNQVYRQAGLALGLISQELENAIPYDFRNSYPDKSDFSGSAEEVTFLIKSSEGVRYVRYYLMEPEHEEKYVLMLANAQTHNKKITQEETKSGFKENYLIREEGAFVDFLNNFDDHPVQKEIIAKNINEEGLRFYYGCSSKQNALMAESRDGWQNQGIPGHVTVEIDFIGSTYPGNLLTLKRDIFIPQGVSEDRG